MTKRVFGWILLAIVGLNVVAILVRMEQGASVGSPLYLIFLLMMFIGGVGLVRKKKNDRNSEAVMKTGE